MFANSARLGSICGWSPSDDRHDIHHVSIPTPTGASTSQMLTFPSSSTPRAVRNPIPRSLSPDSSIHLRDLSDDDEADVDVDADADDPHSISRYHNATSLRRYKLKRSKDPSWAPRPPNAFILFRRNYVEQHKGEAISSSEKLTLSKRAANAWKALAGDGQKPWFDRAKLEAADHLRRNPGYVFRPNKQTRSEMRKHPALLSRREKVEELCLKSHRRNSSSSMRSRSHSQAVDDCPTPGSAGSATSPEQPCTPLSEECIPSMHMESHSRPPSTPPPHLVYPVPTSRDNDRAYLSSAAMLSMPSLLPVRPNFLPKRSLSYTDVSALNDFSDFFVFDDPLTESDDQSIRSFDSYAFGSSPITFYGDTSPEQLLPNEVGTTLQVPEPLTMPLAEPSAAPQATAGTTSYIPPSNGLFERRRRAATTSMIPSPLTVVTSSLAGWARDDLTTARLVPRADPTQAAPSQTVPQPYTHLSVAETMWNPMLQSPSPDMNLLSVPTPEAGMDTTPRAAAFPQNVLSPYDSSPPSLMVPSYDYTVQIPESIPASSTTSYGMDSLELTHDLDYESYRSGLRRYSIGGSMEPFNTPLLVDYSSYYSPNDPIQ